MSAGVRQCRLAVGLGGGLTGGNGDGDGGGLGGWIEQKFAFMVMAMGGRVGLGSQ